jgi:hypothetical protein
MKYIVVRDLEGRDMIVFGLIVHRLEAALERERC